MLSWIFRHRTRLQVVYGPTPPPPLCGERFSSPAGSAEGPPPADGKRPRPGELRVLRGGQVLMRPMPRRVA